MSTAEDDKYNPVKEYMPRGCELGTVGWAGREEHVDFGTGDNDGFTFVMVTLYAGKTPGDKPTPGLAQGREILCNISSMGGFRIPPKGTRVYVLFPAEMEDAPGAGVIVATVEKTHTKDALQKDRVVIDYGDDVHLVIRAKSVSLQDPDNRFLTVGTPRAGGDPGIWLQAADGSGGAISEGKVGFWASDGTDAQTILQMTTTEVKCMKKDGGFWSVDADGFMGFGTNCSIRGAAVYLGSAPVVATKALYGTASGPAAGASASVYISAA